MIILLASDNNFVQHCCVTMTSVLMNNPGAEFYLFTEGLTLANVSLLDNQVKKFGGVLHICKIESEQVRDFPMPSYMSSHISLATYYRLFAAKLIPANVEKVIYLDCDIVVDGSLIELWNYPIQNYALGAVYQSHEQSQCDINGKGPMAYTRLNIPKEYGYFNAGVLLMNLKYWRENNVTQRLFDFIRDNYDMIHAHDQDTLNAVLYRETAALAPTWNYREFFMTKKQYTYPKRIDYIVPIDEPIIIHYVSKPKPWQYYSKHPLKNIYYKYLKYTPFKEFKPIWSWIEFKDYILIPKIFKTIVFLDVLKLRRLIRHR